MKKLVEH